MKRKSITALLLASLLTLSPLAAMAEEYDIGEGSITVSHNGTAQTVRRLGRDPESRSLGKEGHGFEKQKGGVLSYGGPGRHPLVKSRDRRDGLHLLRRRFGAV